MAAPGAQSCSFTLAPLSARTRWMFAAARRPPRAPATSGRGGACVRSVRSEVHDAWGYRSKRACRIRRWVTASARRRVCFELRRRGSETRFVFFEARVPRARGTTNARRIRARHSRFRGAFVIVTDGSVNGGRCVSARCPRVGPGVASQTGNPNAAALVPRRKLKRAEARDDAAHRLHVALSAALVAVDHDQVRVRTRECTARRERSRRCARGRTGSRTRRPAKQHGKKSRRFFSAGTVSAPGAGRALVVVTRDRGEARVQAEQARLRGARKRGGERVVARHAHGHVAVSRDASCDERVRGFKREERGGVWWGARARRRRPSPRGGVARRRRRDREPRRRCSRRTACRTWAWSRRRRCEERRRCSPALHHGTFFRSEEKSKKKKKRYV